MTTENINQLDEEMAMDTINHPKYGKLKWTNDGGVHKIKKEDKPVFAGTHKEVSDRWEAIKKTLNESMVVRDGKVSAEAVMRLAKEMIGDKNKKPTPEDLEAAKKKILDNANIKMESVEFIEKSDLNKVGSMLESTPDEVEDWKASVKAAYPEHSENMQFKSTDQAKHISAEVPGIDRAFGVYDMENLRGHVLGESESLDEALRIVSKHSGEDGIHTANVYRDSDWGEFRVKFYKGGKHVGEDGDYHTDDLGDAKSTADAQLKRYGTLNEVKKPVDGVRESFVDFVESDKVVEAKALLFGMIDKKIAEVVNEKRKEVAKKLFNQK